MSSYAIKVYPFDLDFKFNAGTSRGVLKSKPSYFIQITDLTNNIIGWGEVSILPNLSIDDEAQLIPELERIAKLLVQTKPFGSEAEILHWVALHVEEELPAVKFGVEMALLDVFYGGKAKILDCDFYDRNTPIQINGLVWMGDVAFMQQQIQQKLDDGFSCVKMKIGAISWEDEKMLLKGIRDKFPASKLTLRVDANGAFDVSNVSKILDELAALDVHSIEQPVKAKQLPLMKTLCRSTPVSIALDEELIGVFGEAKEKLLREVRPQFCIFKPSLLGGIQETKEWIDLCDQYEIGWWMTSALESNIGLNAIAQMTSKWASGMPQGLGTGGLFTNNVPSPLQLQSDNLVYSDHKWDYSIISSTNK